MRARLRMVGVGLGLAVAAAAAAQPAPQGSLTVVSAGPGGEVAALAEAREVRIVFSEPMVTLGRIPQPVTAPFFSIRPSIAGTFRWSGTTILIFTPDPTKALPYATRYDVTVAASATATSGRRLAQPYTFSFTTPTVRLLATNWYRQNDRFDRPLVVGLRFNQPVRPADVVPHLKLAFEPHAWNRPLFSPAALARLQARDPAGLARFNAKVAATDAAARSQAPVPFSAASSWDTTRLAPGDDLIVVETTVAPPPESWIRATLDEALPAVQGRATPGQVQTYTVQLEPAFFVDDLRCTSACNPSHWNPIRLRRPADVAQFRARLQVFDVTNPPADAPVKPTTAPKTRELESDEAPWVTLEDAGFERQPPARSYALHLDAGLTARDGQTLGYPWVGIVQNWHESAFTSFGDGHGVWESSGGRVLPFHARNFTGVRQWAASLQAGELMPTIRALQKESFRTPPAGAGIERKLSVVPDRVQSFGLDLSRALAPSGTGLVWAAVEAGDPIPHAGVYDEDRRPNATVVQVTNLGLTVKDSPQNTLVFVTRLDNGEPVPGARVSIVDRQNRTAWNGATGDDGIAVAPDTPLRKRRGWFSAELDFLVIAEKDGDVAYLGSDWTEGIEPWSFGKPFSLFEATPVLRGSVFADRGVYRLGEEVHVKAILRRDTPRGIELPGPGTSVYLSLRDSQDREIDARVVKLGEWGSAEWIYTLPADGALGNYSIQASLDKPDEGPRRLPPAAGGEEDETVEGAEEMPRRMVNGSFLVAAYRRPDFRVDATLTGTPAIAGATLKGVVTARYLFGAAMTKRPVRWTFSRTPIFGPPASLTGAFPDERFTFVGYQEGARSERMDVKGDQSTLDAKGEIALDLATAGEAGLPYAYTLEGEVEDVSRQRIANRASLTVHPAAWYVGIQRPPYFVDQKGGLETALVTVSPDGTVIPGVDVKISLRQVQWHSVRRAEGQGFYTWETERREVDAGAWSVTTAQAPAPLPVPLGQGGYYILRAEATDAEGRLARTEVSFYALGAGYTAWTRYDHNRIDLVPERSRYKPGDTARIMIQSPWEQATALVTMEREGVRSHRRFALTSTQQAITVPIAEGDIPNVFVSVLLVKGRTQAGGEDDGSDPGKPTFRLGYVELQVEDASKRLSVTARADREEFRPARMARVSVSVADADGKPAASEVTLWAVDYGVLSLTGFATPDVLRSVYVPKALQVVTTDSRQRIVSRRVLTPKGTDEGGGGGEEPGAGTLRKDFRVLAFWVGSVVTDAGGRASVDVKLPESLTTYRIMAVAGDKRSRFGSGESEIRINKPLTLKPTFPRFLARGDRATFGAVLTSQLREGGTAVVTIRSLDPKVVELLGESRKTVTVGPGGSVEVRFDARAVAIGRARLQMTARLGGESDAFQDVLPVDVLSSPETVAAYGEVAAAPAVETVTVPAGVVPGFGGLRVELASTAMVGLGEGARYLVEYPYGCAEQRASRALALLLAADLGDAFRIPGVDPPAMRTTAQAAIASLERFQCPDGGFTYWLGACGWRSSPYLTSYVLHVLRLADSLKYAVRADVRTRAYDFLEEELSAPPPAANDGWWPTYTAWQAFAVHELVAGGRPQDSNLTRLYGYLDRMPVFALAHLADAMATSGETGGARAGELRRRMLNAVLPEGGNAHVEELSDPYLLWFWNSNVRSTAIVLGHLARTGGGDRLVPSMVRWLMAARTKGRWGNTQENAWALEGLVEYYRKYEAEPPHFKAVVALGGDELVKQTFEGRSADARSSELTMADLLARAAPGTSRELAFNRQGTGTLFYVARLRYAADDTHQDGLDSGFAIRRTYAPVPAEGSADEEPRTTFKAGDLVRVTLAFDLTKERRYVAVTDPLPAGFEAVESWFATTARDLVRTQEQESQPQDWMSWWQRGGFDHVERLDDRVRLFATRLSEGHHEFSYVVRATTAGTFKVAPARAEEMYEPEVFGRTGTVVVDVKP